MKKGEYSVLVVDAGCRVTYPSNTIWKGQTLRYGSRGTYVKQLQDMLNQAGYNVGKADGIFGKKTKSAVMSFQRANRLAQDGIAGKNTYNALIKNLQNKAKEQAQKNASSQWSGQTLRYGSKGNAVRELQTMLNNAGYSVGKVDGIFGKQTLEALKKFQKSRGLKQDGIAGANTYNNLKAY
nr:peptidoglycan-binding protein [Bacillus kexueae]